MTDEEKAAKTRARMEEVVDEFVRQLEKKSPEASLVVDAKRDAIINWFFHNKRKMSPEDLKKFLEDGKPARKD